MSAPRIVPLDYQLLATQAMRDALSNPAAKPLAVIPTGGGKSVIIGALAQSILRQDRSLKIIAVARSRVILRHNQTALAALAPEATSAEFKGGALAPGVTFATAQKLYKSPQIIGSADLLVIDEADQAFGENGKQYGAILAAARRYCGLTGTPFRLKDRETAPIFGAGAPFDPPCFSIGKAELVARGRIVPIEPARSSVAFDVSKLRVNDAGFFETRLVSTAPGMLAAIAGDIGAALADDPCPFLVYCLTVDQAEKQAAALNDAGVRTAVLDGRMSKAERDGIEAAFRAGDYQGVCSVQTIDRGANFASVGLVVIALASVSRTRVEQIVGRVMRSSPGKRAGCVLDYGGHGARFGSFMFDYAEAIAFDARAKREDRETGIVAAMRKGGSHLAKLMVRPDQWADFMSGDARVLGLKAEARAALENGRRYVLLTVATDKGILSPAWLPSADYGGAHKTERLLDALSFEWPFDKPFDLSPWNIVNVIEGAPLPAAVIAHRVRDRDGKPRIEPFGFVHGDGRKVMFDHPPAYFARSPVAVGAPSGEDGPWRPFAPLPGEISAAREISF